MSGQRTTILSSFCCSYSLSLFLWYAKLFIKPNSSICHTIHPLKHTHTHTTIHTAYSIFNENFANYSLVGRDFNLDNHSYCSANWIIFEQREHAHTLTSCIEIIEAISVNICVLMPASHSSTYLFHFLLVVYTKATQKRLVFHTHIEQVLRVVRFPFFGFIVSNMFGINMTVM